jgi:hypothetical protein
MGTKLDMRRREKLQRVDDDSRRSDVKMARNFIFKQGAPVSGSWVNNILNNRSLVPTRVSLYIYVP